MLFVVYYFYPISGEVRLHVQVCSQPVHLLGQFYGCDWFVVFGREVCYQLDHQ